MGQGEWLLLTKLLLVILLSFSAFGSVNDSASVRGIVIFTLNCIVSLSSSKVSLL